jgi:hypothetical protein
LFVKTKDPKRHVARQFSVADSAALALALLTPSTDPIFPAPPRGEIANHSRSHIISTMSTVTEVEAALERFTPDQMREVSDWIATRLMPDETPEQLAAIDAGRHSLRTEPTLSAEQIRQNIRSWVAR